MHTTTEDLWLSYLDELSENDYFIADDFITDEFYDQIMNYFHKLEQDNELKKAGIGAGGELQVKASVRGDFIYWLDEARDTELAPFFEFRDEFMYLLRRFCFLSLSGSEFHLAKYPEGSHYDRHLDQFGARSNRQITILLYLNKHWKKGDGGELVIYTDSGDIIAEPIAKRLLVFKSDVIEHEVLTTQVPRYSLTGWLLHQPESLGYLFG